MRKRPTSRAMAGKRAQQRGQALMDRYAQVDGILADHGIRISSSDIPGTTRAADAARIALNAGSAAGGIIASAATGALATTAAASGGVIASLAGSAAVFPVGTVLAAAAAVAVVVKSLFTMGRNRRVAYKAGNRVQVYVDGIADALQPPDQATRDTIRTRLIEILPHLSGTYDERGRGTRRLKIASVQDRRPYGSSTWARTGDRRVVKGIFEVFRGAGSGAQRMEQAALANDSSAEALGQAISQLPLGQRRAVLTGAAETFLGPKGLVGLPPQWRSGPLPGVSRGSEKALAAAAVGVAALGALALATS